MGCEVGRWGVKGKARRTATSSTWTATSSTRAVARQALRAGPEGAPRSA